MTRCRCEKHWAHLKSALEIGNGSRSGIERRQSVDQHDLPVEPCEVVAEEGPHHDVLVGLEAALHHCPQGVSRWPCTFGQVEG